MSEEKKELLSIDDIYLREVKTKIDAPWRLQRQLERCNILAAYATDSIRSQEFNDSVEALLGDVPISIKRAVLAREDDYTDYFEPEWRYEYNCGKPIGTPESPVMLNDPNDWDYDPSKQTVQWSPRLVEVPPQTNYKKLLEVIKEELESGGASWEYTKTLKEAGKVSKGVPEPIVKEYETTIKNLILEHREHGINYSYNDLLKALQKLTPRTPTPPEGDEDE